MSVITTAPSARVSIPEGEHGTAKVTRFTTEPDSLQNRMAALRGRGTRPGTYTRLDVNGRLWTSDTDAEWRDHHPATSRISRDWCKRVLINGLGIGMVLQHALNQAHIEHVDVVEINPDVVALIGPHYLRDPRVRIHTEDAYTMAWAPGVRWDVAWHDIWIDLCTDNLKSMATLHRKYGRRVDWQGSWGRELLQSQRRREQRHPWY